MTTENVDVDATETSDEATEATSGLTLEQALAELSKVRREAAKHRTEKQAQKAVVEELQKYKDAEKTELEKAVERAQRAEQELTSVRREKAARDAAKAAGLDSELADLVQGETEEELAASAKALAERLGTAKPNLGNFNAGSKTPIKAQENASEAFANFLKNL